MGKYFCKRVASAIPLLLVISFVIFMFIHMIPGDPARMIAGQDATKEDVEVVREQLGLNDPLLVQYGKYMKGLFTGDLGDSIKNGKTVVETIAPRLKPTIMLTVSAMIWATIIGIALGIISAVFHGRALDYIGMIIAISGISVPSFWLGLILLSIFGVQLRWINVAGGSTDFKSMILPALTLALAMSAKYTRQVRATVLEELNKDYVTGARARGIRSRVIIWKSVMKASMLTIITPVSYTHLTLPTIA